MPLPRILSIIYTLRLQTRELGQKAANNNDYFVRSLFELNERLYLKACDLARCLIDDIDDDAVRLGLRLHYVNGICWHETALLTSDAKIRRKCHDFLRKEAKYNV